MAKGRSEQKILAMKAEFQINALKLISFSAEQNFDIVTFKF
jgi:hypothetical protein